MLDVDDKTRSERSLGREPHPNVVIGRVVCGVNQDQVRLHGERIRDRFTRRGDRDPPLARQ
jgi:hypothetical protein